MKVLIQNRIDCFTEVQLSALAAFQAEQTDGRLSKNLGEEEGEKKKEQSFSGNGLTSAVRHDAHIGPLQLNFLHCFWVTLPSLSKSNKGKPHSTQSWNKLHLPVALPSVTQARHRVTKWCRGLCLEKLILIRFVSPGPWLLFKNLLYLLIGGTSI